MKWIFYVGAIFTEASKVSEMSPIFVIISEIALH